MKKIYNIISTLLILSLWLILSSWGSVGHRIINQHAPASFPPGMAFLKGSFSTILVDSASAADDRKGWDYSESAKHYIDIDNYNGFILNGKIPMTEDSLGNIYGYSFIMDNGVLPWATIAAFDSLKACFQRNNFYKASLFAADLGHYVGDGHMPLHITQNYDGQNTGQHGVHSRYESHMIGDYSDQINYSDDSAQLINDVPGFIFTYLYRDYKYVDSVLLADQYATSVAGNTYSSAYYQALWDKTGVFTIGLFKDASWSLASLIYTAWTQAGHPDGLPILNMEPSLLGQNNPNPFQKETYIPFVINVNSENVSLKVWNSNGKLVSVLVDGKLKKGKHLVAFNGSNLLPGIYFYSLQTGDEIITRKMILTH